MDASGRDDHDQEHIMFDMIQIPEGEPEDDGSQYLNESGEGIFEEEPTDEGHTNNDGEGNDLQLTKTGEEYIRPLVIITCIN
jgi:hypothetical protein